MDENLDMHLMDVVTTSLYRSPNNDVYTKVPEGFKMPEIYKSSSLELYSIKLQKSIETIRTNVVQSPGEYLLKQGYQINPICPCVFIKKSQLRFAIITLYVDDLNIIGIPEELSKTVEYLKKKF